MTEDFPPNSKKAKAEKPEKDVSKIITGEVVKRRKGLITRIAETFTGEDINTVSNHLVLDVMVPSAKTMIFDLVSEGIEQLLFGGSGQTRSFGKKRPGAASYSSYYNAPKKPARQEDYRSMDRDISHRARATHDFNEIVIDSRVEAEEVLERLVDLINSYDVATVSDLYDLVGITGSYTDDKWGWYNLQGSAVRRVREGYLLDLPSPRAIT